MPGSGKNRERFEPQFLTNGRKKSLRKTEREFSNCALTLVGEGEAKREFELRPHLNRGEGERVRTAASSRAEVGGRRVFQNSNQ